MSNLYSPYHLREILLISRGLDFGEGPDIAERFQVPIPYLQDSRFLRQPIRQVLELDSPPRNPDGKLLVEELSRDQQIAVAGPGPELHHVLQADPRLLQAAPSVDLVDQALGVGLAHLLSRHGPMSEPRSEYGETGGTAT